MRPIFRSSPTLTLRLILFCALSVALMTMENRNEKLLLVRDFLAQLVYPVQYLVSLPGKAYQELDDYLVTHASLLEENRRLRQSQILLQSRLQQFDILSAENQRLNGLLSSSRKITHRVLVANLLAVDLDPFRKNVLLDKGSSDDVYVGQPIIDASGVMGQVTQVTGSSSTALLLSDPGHSVPVRVIRNGLRSIANGTGRTDRLRLDYIPGNGDVEEGDVLVTSGLGRRFPADYPVATVTHVSRPSGEPFATVYAEPAAGLDSSHQVLLVWSNETPRNAPDSPGDEPAPPGIMPWPSIDSLALLDPSFQQQHRWQ